MRWAGLLALSVLLLSCSRVDTLTGRDRLGSLNESLRSYAAALRWGHVHDVLAFHAPREGVRTAQVPAGHEDFTVTRVEVVQVLLSEDREEAEVEIRVESVRGDTAVVRKRVFTHAWWLDGDSGRWFNGDDFPAFWLSTAPARRPPGSSGR